MLSAMGFIYKYANFVSLLSIILVLELFRISSKFNNKTYYKIWVLFGCTYFAMVLSWVYKIKASELINDGYLSEMFLIFTFVLMIGVFSTGIILTSCIVRRLKVSTENNTILLIPFIWIACEYLRSILFSVLFTGDGASIGPFWNFGTTGLLASDTPLKYSSRIIGLYGLSFITILIAIAIYKIFSKQWKYLALLLVPVLMSLAGWLLYSNTDGKLLSVKSISLPGHIETGYEADLKGSLTNSKHTDALVLPEYSRFFIDDTGSKTSNSLHPNINLIIDSSSAIDGKSINNRISYYTHDGKVLKQYKKWFLIPGGEYIPYIYHFIIFYSGNRNLIDQFMISNAINSSDEHEQPFEYNNTVYGAIACSGAIAPSLYRTLVTSGAEVLVNSASVSTLGVSRSYYLQAQQMSKFIATANARPYIQSSRGGPSFILNKDGGTNAFTSESEKLKVLDSTIETNSNQTIYGKFGEWLIPASILTVIGYIIKLQFNKKSLRNS